MYTAKILSKLDMGDRIRFSVEFSDGVNTSVETIEPDNRNQFDSWVAGRLFSLNSVQEMKTELSENQDVSPTPAPEPTAEQLADATWKRKYFKYVAVKKDLIDTGILTGTEPYVQTLLQEVKDGLTQDRFNSL